VKIKVGLCNRKVKMKLFVIIFVIFGISNGQLGRGRKTKCFSIPSFPQKVENVIKLCQSEVKTNLIDDLVNAGSMRN
jgi:hypothetical protein